MLGYVRYDPYQLDGDAVSYMDIASALLHGRWQDVVNGYWFPGYPALLALGKLISHADRMQELYVFYWVNYFIFLFSFAGTAFFVRSLLRFRARYTDGTSTSMDWAVPGPLLYLAAFSVVLFSWEQEFSPGKVRVDGLYAGLLLFAFGCLLRVVSVGGHASAVGTGLSLGLAYLVKSPGFVLAGMAFVVLAIYLLWTRPSIGHPKRKLFLVLLVFGAVVAPYITALSIQKGRLDWGDSARLNYAWMVAGAQPMHLLQDQLWRFGDATIALKHPDAEILSDPVVVYFPHFSRETYGAWFDPSYSSEGVAPVFRMRTQLSTFLHQSRNLLRFVIGHSVLLAFPAVALVYGVRVTESVPVKKMFGLLCIVFLLSCLMYMGVFFEDRYIAGQFWLAWTAVLGLMVVPSASTKVQAMIVSTAFFLAITVFLLGVIAVMRYREIEFLTQTYTGHYDPEEYHAALALHRDGAPADSEVTCFGSCGRTYYWARLASVHITSEIYDQRYRKDGEGDNAIWESLPNKPAIYAALRGVGSKGIVGLFDDPPPTDEGWQRLAGRYYWMPLTQAAGTRPAP